MEIIYEDNHIIAVNKTSSDLVQGDSTGDKSLDIKVKEYIKEKYNKSGNVFIGVTHRIDRPVSGLVLFAKTSKALTRLNTMFRQGEMKKIYWAIVKNPPLKKESTLINHLLKNQKQNKSYCYDNPVRNAKEAILHYKLVASSESYYLLEIELKTGRHHQIRCQLAAINCPIKGDLKYGFPRSNENKGINLHSLRLEFMHPVKQEMLKLSASLPTDDNLWKFFSGYLK